MPSPSKKKMPRFVLPSCSEDSDSNFSASDDSDSDESSASVCSVDDICISNRNSTRTKKSKKAVKGSTPRSNTVSNNFCYVYTFILKFSCLEVRLDFNADGFRFYIVQMLASLASFVEKKYG